MKRIIVKTVLLLIFVLAVEKVFGIVEPLVTVDLSIKSQLADSDAAYAGFELYKSLRSWAWVLYLGVAVAVFWRELRVLFGGYKKRK